MLVSHDSILIVSLEPLLVGISYFIICETVWLLTTRRSDHA